MPRAWLKTCYSRGEREGEEEEAQSKTLSSSYCDQTQSILLLDRSAITACTLLHMWPCTLKHWCLLLATQLEMNPFKRPTFYLGWCSRKHIWSCQRGISSKAASFPTYPIVVPFVDIVTSYYHFQLFSLSYGKLCGLSRKEKGINGKNLLGKCINNIIALLMPLTVNFHRLSSICTSIHAGWEVPSTHAH